jgi:hypothetical protein
MLLSDAFPPSELFDFQPRRRGELFTSCVWSRIFSFVTPSADNASKLFFINYESSSEADTKFFSPSSLEQFFFLHFFWLE